MDYDRVLQAILDIGEEMVVAGAEVSRVTESIYRMCESYGADRVNVFLITSNIQVTMEAPDGRILTHIRSIIKNEPNFDRLDYLNDLCRKICKETPEPEEIQKRLAIVMARPKQTRGQRILAALLVAGGFAVFFGAGPAEALCALIMGFAVTNLQYFFARRNDNQVIGNFAVSFLAGLIAILLVRIGLGRNQDVIMISGIMLLIPGIVLTNAVRDMLTGDVATGLLRLASSLITAAAIALGFATAILVTGGAIIQAADPADPVALSRSVEVLSFIQITSACVGSVGYAMLLNIKGRQIFYAGGGGALSWGIYLIVYMAAGSYFLGNLIAALCVAVFAELMARVNRAPATIFLTAAAIPLIPGKNLYYTVFGILAEDYPTALENGVTAIAISLAISIGFVVVTAAMRYRKYLQHPEDRLAR